MDVSIFNERLDTIGIHGGNTEITKLLEMDAELPDLVSLDISGWKDLISVETVHNFISAHPQLEYLGIVFTELTADPSFSQKTHPRYPHRLIIGGLGNKEQIAVSSCNN